MKISKNLEKLVSIIKQLRSDDGCPWDKKQTRNSLTPYFLEEVYEVRQGNRQYQSTCHIRCNENDDDG